MRPTPQHEYAVILGYSTLYAADETEIALPNAAAAHHLLAQKRPDILERLQHRISSIMPEGGEAYLDAVVLGTARLGLRHGSLGNDFHHYHNEDHVLDLADRRLGRMLESLNHAALHQDDWLCLALFAACHDLRQRETLSADGPVGGNEAASIAETFRILDACGFDRSTQPALYIALELMIAGSTFDPRLPEKNPDTVNLTGGALARSFGLWLDSTRPLWRQEPVIARGERLGRMSADMDTANVGESFALLGKSALQLCEEQLQRRGLSLDQAPSGAFALDFLSQGQLHYFFDLHRFASREGQRVFGPQKQENADKVWQASEQLIAAMAQHSAAGAPSAKTVMQVYQGICLEV
jgi:hypothetical protein